MPLTDPWSSMVSWIFVHPQIRNPLKIWRDNRHHRSSPLQQMALNQSGNSGRFAWTLLASVVQSRLPTQSLQVVHLIQIFCHGALEKCSKIHRVLRIHQSNIVVGESKATQTGLQGPAPHLEKRKCVIISLMRRDASWMHRDSRHIH